MVAPGLLVVGMTVGVGLVYKLVYLLSTLTLVLAFFFI
jgi:hypothetical protein